MTFRHRRRARGRRPAVGDREVVTDRAVSTRRASTGSSPTPSTRSRSTARAPTPLLPAEVTTLARPRGRLLATIATVNDVHFGETECGLTGDAASELGPVLRAEPGRAAVSRGDERRRDRRDRARSIPTRCWSRAISPTRHRGGVRGVPRARTARLGDAHAPRPRQPRRDARPRRSRATGRRTRSSSTA